MLNFDKETISIVQNDSTGAIIASGELTIVGLPNEFFKILLVLILMMICQCIVWQIIMNKKEELVDQVKEITQELEDEDEVPLNDPFAGK